MMPATGTGGRHRVVALGILGATAAAGWFGIVMPMTATFQDMGERLQARRALAFRLEALAAQEAMLRGMPGADDRAADDLLEGDTDAVAAALLQRDVRAAAARAGTGISTIETLPPETVGGRRRIALRVSTNAPYPVLVELFHAIGGGRPAKVIEDLSLQASVAHTAALPLSVSFLVAAFRAGTP